MPNANGWTPTQRRLHDVLKDGEPHGLRELFNLLNDAEGAALDYVRAKKTLGVHIVEIRKRLRLKGLDVICQNIHRRQNYRIVRPITSSE